MTDFQIRTALPSGFTWANAQQTDRFVDTGSVNGASKVCLVATGEAEASYAEEILGQRFNQQGPLSLAIRLRPPREIGDIESIARKDTTDLERYKADYTAGWAASRRYGRGEVESTAFDTGTTSHAWDDGYLDQAAGRPKWHLTWCLDHDTCGEG